VLCLWRQRPARPGDRRPLVWASQGGVPDGPQILGNGLTRLRKNKNIRATTCVIAGLGEGHAWTSSQAAALINSFRVRPRTGNGAAGRELSGGAA